MRIVIDTLDEYFHQLPVVSRLPL
ncbi:uncharacterized protein FRV6_08528 [Fusarium oxysporum]|uniref:Uncharacterized protein n=1 Tax=Fusarium oxysporum TaxID=5507 RepID=A0A2H3TF66_FUSOX|nr:uncharacterized protein FRV6_08528 [Fusarium oxysporum]